MKCDHCDSLIGHNAYLSENVGVCCSEACAKRYDPEQVEL